MNPIVCLFVSVSVFCVFAYRCSPPGHALGAVGRSRGGLSGVTAHNRLRDPDQIQSLKWQGQPCFRSTADPETESRRRVG